MEQESQPEARSVTVGAAVTPAEAERLQALAERMGATKSAALRAALVAGLDRLEGVEADALPAPPLTRVESLAEGVLAQLTAHDKAIKKALDLIYGRIEDLHEKFPKKG